MDLQSALAVVSVLQYLNYLNLNDAAVQLSDSFEHSEKNLQTWAEVVTTCNRRGFAAFMFGAARGCNCTPPQGDPAKMDHRVNYLEKSALPCYRFVAPAFLSLQQEVCDGV